MRRTTFVIIVLATLSLAFGYTASFGIPLGVSNVHAMSRAVMLKGSFATGWNGSNPGPTISLTQGDSVTLNLVSTDGAPHIYVIDVAHAGIIPNPNCSVDKCSNQFSSSTTFMFTADMAAGTYSYYCSIHLEHMTGSLVVHSSTSTAPDFTVTSNPSMLTVAQGSSTSATITLASLNGFTGTVILTAAVSPSGPAISFSSTSIPLPANRSISSTLTVSATSMGIYSTPVSNGAYTVTIMETSGSVSHSTTVPVNVGPTSAGASSSMPTYGSGLSGTALLGVVVAVIAFGIVATVVALRRRRTTA